MTKETTGTGAARPVATRRRSRLVEALLQYGTVLALFVMVVIMSFLSPVFLTVSNLLQILLQAAINLLMALGMTFVILTAGIDLSVGSTAALAGLAVAALLKGGLPWPVAALLALGVGLVVGLINGWLIAVVRITPFIVTLGMLSVVRGAALVFSNGRPIFGYPAVFNQTLGGDVAGIPMPAIIALVAALISWLVLRYTRLGEYTYAMGGNEEATRLSGVNVRYYKIAVYVICAVFAALAGVVLTARLGAAEPIAASGYELNAIAATVMGGTSLFGGEGGVGGTIVGALIIATLINGLNLMNVQAFYQQLAIGLVIILAVVLDRFRA
jgi:ribose transport system permease protein